MKPYSSKKHRMNVSKFSQKNGIVAQKKTLNILDTPCVLAYLQTLSFFPHHAVLNGFFLKAALGFLYCYQVCCRFCGVRLRQEIDSDQYIFPSLSDVRGRNFAYLCLDGVANVLSGIRLRTLHHLSTLGDVNQTFAHGDYQNHQPSIYSMLNNCVNKILLSLLGMVEPRRLFCNSNIVFP